MRPTAHPQSALRAPLNVILATEANVRVLRVLGGLSSPIGATELAKRTQLQRSSVHRAIKTLEDTGIVEYVGTAPHAQIVLRDRHPLAKAIRQLFKAEQLRYDDLLMSLKRAAESLEPPPFAAWLEGPVALGTDRRGEPLVVSVVDNSRSLEKSTEAMREALERLERRFDVQMEVRGRTQADLDAIPADASEGLLDAIPLLGVPPGGLLKRYRELWKTRNIRMHLDHDQRALSVGHTIADAIMKDPSLIGEARKYIARRWRDASAGERKELAEWKRVLTTASPASLRRLLTDPGERGTRLRQTIPFVGILSAERPR